MKKFLAAFLSVVLIVSNLCSTPIVAKETDFPTVKVTRASEFKISSRFVIATADNQFVMTIVTDALMDNPEYDWLDEYENVAGARVILAPWGKGNNINQKWTIVSARTDEQPDAKKIISPVTLQGLSITYNTTREGVEAHPRDYYGQPNQKFEFELGDDGYFRIKNASNGMYLGVKDSVAEKGSVIAQYKDSDSISQRWNVYKIEDELATRIVVPQTGWAPKASKTAVLSIEKKPSVDPILTVTKDGVVVYSEPMTMPPNMLVFEMLAYSADLTKLEEEGTYVASVNIDGVEPVEFIIANDVYRNVRGYDQYDLSVEDNMSIKEVVEYFFAWQRCDESDFIPEEEYSAIDGHIPGKIYGEDYNLPLYVAVNEPAENGGAESAKYPTGEIIEDLYGGYIDATSTDKDTGNIAKAATSMLHTYKYAQDSADREAILGEIIWASDYLLKIQKDNGAFYLAVKPYDSYPVKDGHPRHVVELDGAGLACRVGATLAEASVVLRESDPERSAKYLEGAIKAWEYYEANPENFILRTAFPGVWTGNSGSVLACAVQLYIATGEEKYKEYCDREIKESVMIDGVLTKKSGPVPGQVSYFNDEVMYGQSLEALAAYYPYAGFGVKMKINKLTEDWVDYWISETQNAYGFNPRFCATYFGCCGWTMQVAEKAALLAITTNNKKCLDLATEHYDFVTGKNPTGASFIVGFGYYLGCEPFFRTRDETKGAVLPGLFVHEFSGNLTSREIDGSIFWKMSETTIDVGGAVVSTIAMLDHAFTVDYADISHGNNLMLTVVLIGAGVVAVAAAIIVIVTLKKKNKSK